MPYVELIKKIKEYSYKSETTELDKNLVKIYNQEYTGYDIGCAVNYIIEKNKYEVYMFIGLGKELAINNVLSKIFNSIDEAVKYYEELISLVDLNDLDLILKLVSESKN